MKLKALFSLVTSIIMVISLATLAIAAPSEPIIKQNATEVQQSIEEVVPFNAEAPSQPEKGEIVEFTLEAKLATMEINGIEREVWTFNGSVPAPTLRVNQGDTVRFTLVNKDPNMAHGLDFHAGQMDMGTYHQSIMPGESITFDWNADYPGVFYYHCSADPVIMHIANGMFGAVIVDPPGYEPEGKEYVLIQHEWYKNSTDLNALINDAPEALAFNGVPMQYVNSPLTAEAGEKVRFYFVNAGINNFSSFHVIGTIFDKVLLDGNPKNTLHGVQTVAVPPGGALVTELYADTGTYAILTHSMKDAMKGALGILKVGDATAEAGGHVSTEPVETDNSSTTEHEHEEETATAGTTIEMKNSMYSPNKLEVAAGTTVTWVNKELFDTTLHSIMANDGKTFNSRDTFSSDLKKDETFSYTFNTPGTYEYHCEQHPFMKGTVIVK